MRLQKQIRPQASTVIIAGLVVAIAAAATRYYMRSHLAPATNTDTGMLNEISTKLGVKKPALTKDQVAIALADSTAIAQFPTEISIKDGDNNFSKAVVEYSFDAKLQSSIEQLYRQAMPDYGAFVAMDATTGRILSMVSYSKSGESRENLALRATFPSASVFKVVTAAAAMEENKITPNTVMAYTGQNHTLYRSNVFKTTANRWTRYITLKEAFAKSINTVFGKLGAYTVRPIALRDYADRFGFNRKIAADVPIQTGHAPIPDDPWGVAEAASGYTRENTMSPLQGALIASTVVNDGVMMEPFLVQSVFQPDGTRLYTAQPTVSRSVVDIGTAEEIRQMMRETISNGTCRKAFHGFNRQCALIDVGGKTGTLTGLDPKGKYDWFVGYAEYGGQKIAYASLTISEKVWRIKSSQVARHAIETFFKDKLPVSDRVVANLHHRRHHRQL
jgi:peptidoglycan glycosyltransferase